MIRLLRLPEVEAAVGLKKSAIYDHIKKGQFPAPVKTGGGQINAWASDEIQAYIERLKAAREAAA